MKNFCITFLVIIIIIATAVFASGAFGGAEGGREPAEYLRIHVRANSNSEADQNVKYTVKDAVVKLITPYAAQCGDKAEAMRVIGGKTGEIARECARVLEENGFYYGARAEVRREYFPTRVYDGVTLPAGTYDALIVELGSGEGDNWWCVLYPPLCFTSGTQDVVYRSLIYDIIEKFFRG